MREGERTRTDDAPAGAPAARGRERIDGRRGERGGTGTGVGLATRVRGSTARVPALLGAQLAFNVGFYAVVPFLAVVLADDFGLAAAAVALVLGVRTFAQQGMFLVGGLLADRWGPRAVILVGCGIRVVGFASLAAALLLEAPALALFVAGAVLTGLGGALFSPGLEVLVAAADRDRRASGDVPRVTLFAWLAVVGEVGAVTGPLVGTALLGLGFEVVALGGALLFVLTGVALVFLLPRGSGLADASGRVLSGESPGMPERGAAPRSRPAPASALRDRAFVAFAALHAVDLLAYNQLYLSIPLGLRAAGAPDWMLGLVFAYASALTILTQLPLARWAAGRGPRAALRTGYAVTASGFAALACATAARSAGVADAGLVVGALVAAVTLLMIGHLLSAPTARGIVPSFAGGRPTGSYFGLLASAGGASVLVGNLAIGALLELGASRSELSLLPWLLLAVLPAVSAILAPRILERRLAPAVLPRASSPERAPCTR